MGRKPLFKDKVSVPVSIEKSQYEDLKRYAFAYNVSVAEVIRKSISMFFDTKSLAKEEAV